MTNKFLKATLAGLILTMSNLANAGLIIDVDFRHSIHTTYEGSFTGEDLNNNNLLEFPELTSFILDGNSFANLTQLDGFGDFDITNNNWIPNAIAWVGTPDIAWFTYNNRRASVNTQGFGGSMNTVVSVRNNSVPEPTTLAIFALGMVGLASRRFKKPS